jgi:ABC-2 type transport system ATP-binding protein
MSVPIIEVSNLTKKYGDTNVVDNISFKVEKGKIFAFLGPNGAGKSTTIKMLTTLLLPTSGQIKLDNYDVVTQPGKARGSLGIVFQDPSLDDELSAYENMNIHGVFYHMKAADRKKRINELLHLVELWDRRNDFVKAYSGGMKRRLEIARGLMHHPRVFFLDEPTLGLDPQTRNKIWDYIKQLNQAEDVTIFFTTHYMEEAEDVADQVAIIDKGKIIDIGSSEELRKQTNTKSLEKAFLALTGKELREEHASGRDTMRRRYQMRGRR